MLHTSHCQCLNVPTPREEPDLLDLLAVCLRFLRDVVVDVEEVDVCRWSPEVDVCKWSLELDVCKWWPEVDLCLRWPRDVECEWCFDLAWCEDDDIEALAFLVLVRRGSGGGGGGGGGGCSSSAAAAAARLSA